MLELFLCSMLTILPDYLYRRYGQDKRLGREITLFSVWYELRFGIVGCVMLTVGLITVVFYNHPKTTNVTSFFRTVPIVPEPGCSQSNSTRAPAIASVASRKRASSAAENRRFRTSTVDSWSVPKLGALLTSTCLAAMALRISVRLELEIQFALLVGSASIGSQLAMPFARSSSPCPA